MKLALTDRELTDAIARFLEHENVKASLSGYTDADRLRSHLKRHFGLVYGVSFDRVGLVLSKFPLQEMIDRSTKGVPRNDR